jgi:hypothetical protein
MSVKATACPKCGAKVNNPLSGYRWLGVIVAVLVIFAIFSGYKKADATKAPSDSPASTTKSYSELSRIYANQPPPDQDNFAQLVTKNAKLFEQAKNELQESSLRRTRKKELAAALIDRSVTDWIGKIESLETNSDGKAMVSLSIGDNIEIKTWNNALSDYADNTLIDESSPVYESLFNLTKGQRVKFSGTFLSSTTDHISETSLTIDGSMKRPEFLFRFATIKAIK